ncbi:hypothetical protein BDZ45DRAFT_352053 [Acephala macrosclerotiorum]|nr:hypothetical protein BDZ45DRAFT_352053 [Acephala macrosclerotiorum]
MEVSIDQSPFKSARFLVRRRHPRKHFLHRCAHSRNKGWKQVSRAWHHVHMSLAPHVHQPSTEHACLLRTFPGAAGLPSINAKNSSFGLFPLINRVSMYRATVLLMLYSQWWTTQAPGPILVSGKGNFSRMISICSTVWKFMRKQNISSL